MDQDQLTIVTANNIFMALHTRELKGECEYLLYKSTCEFLTARLRVNAASWNKLAEDLENGKDPNSS